MTEDPILEAERTFAETMLLHNLQVARANTVLAIRLQQAMPHWRPDLSQLLPEGAEL